LQRRVHVRSIMQAGAKSARETMLRESMHGNKPLSDMITKILKNRENQNADIAFAITANRGERENRRERMLCVINMECREGQGRHVGAGCREGEGRATWRLAGAETQTTQPWRNADQNALKSTGDQRQNEAMLQPVVRHIMLFFIIAAFVAVVSEKRAGGRGNRQQVKW